MSLKQLYQKIHTDIFIYDIHYPCYKAQSRLEPHLHYPHKVDLNCTAFHFETIQMSNTLLHGVGKYCKDVHIFQWLKHSQMMLCEVT